MSEILRRETFSRFGDDLCQQILSYLPLEDKLRTECVDRQWKRLVFAFPFGNRVEELDYPLKRPDNYRHRKGKTAKEWLTISENVLKKCHFMSGLKVWPVCETHVLALIVENSKSLLRIDLRFDKPMDAQVLTQFAKKCGKTIESFKIRELSEQDFRCESGLSLLSDYSQDFPRIRAISLSIDSEKCFEYFIGFTDEYKQRIKSLDLKLRFGFMLTHVNQTFEQISRFVSLNTIRLTLECFGSVEIDLKVCAQLLAKNCPQLKSFSLEMNGRFEHSNQTLLSSLESLSFIRTLSLKRHLKELDSLESLKAFTQLSKLSLMNVVLKESQIIDIPSYCPQLESIEVKTPQKLSDKTLYSLSKLNSLKRLRIIGPPYEDMGITDSGVCALLSNCIQLNAIELKCSVSIGEQTLEALKRLTDNSSKVKRKIYFSFFRIRTAEQSEQPIDPNLENNVCRVAQYWPHLGELPESLTVHIQEHSVCEFPSTDFLHKYFKYFIDYNPDLRDDPNE